MRQVAIAANVTRFGGWLLNTADNLVGPLATFSGGSQAEIFISSPWGVGILRAFRDDPQRADDAAKRDALRRPAL